METENPTNIVVPGNSADRRLSLSFWKPGLLAACAIAVVVPMMGCNGSLTSGASSSGQSTSSSSATDSDAARYPVCLGIFTQAGQDPTIGSRVPESQIAQEVHQVAAVCSDIRTYSCEQGNEFVPKYAAEYGATVTLGIWLGGDKAANTREIQAGLALAKQYPCVQNIIVGSEVLYRGDLSESDLSASIKAVRSALPAGCRLTYADTFETWIAHPALAQLVDFITIHDYPCWAGIAVDKAVATLASDYATVCSAFPGKNVVIGETGWPTAGASNDAAVPSPANSKSYFSGVIAWAKARNASVRMFEFFDEPWKNEAHNWGPHFGLYASNGSTKSVCRKSIIVGSPGYGTAILPL